MLRSGAIAHTVTRAWASAACGAQGASATNAAAAATGAAAGACDNAIAALSCRLHSLGARADAAAPSPDVSDRSATSPVASSSSASSSRTAPHLLRLQRAGHAHAFTTSAASSQAASNPVTKLPRYLRPKGQPHVERVVPDVAIPSSSLAVLADEKEAQEARAAGVKAHRSDLRRPKPAGGSAEAGDAAASTSPAVNAASGDVDLSDPEVRLVFDKLVGGLTKCGKKTVARRIVLDAMRIMRQQLKKGNLEEIK